MLLPPHKEKGPVVQPEAEPVSLRSVEGALTRAKHHRRRGSDRAPEDTGAARPGDPVGAFRC